MSNPPNQAASLPSSIRKSTAKFVRSEVNKTTSAGNLKVWLLELAFAVVVGLTVSCGYIHYLLG